MSFKRIMLAAVSVAMLAAVMASSASAAATTGGFWLNSAGTTYSVGTVKKVECEVKSGTSFVLNGNLGEGLTPVELQATGVDCLNGTLQNTSTVGVDAGELTFTGVTVVKPANLCR